MSESDHLEAELEQLARLAEGGLTITEQEATTVLQALEVAGTFIMLALKDERFKGVAQQCYGDDAQTEVRRSGERYRAAYLAISTRLMDRRIATSFGSFDLDREGL